MLIKSNSSQASPVQFMKQWQLSAKQDKNSSSKVSKDYVELVGRFGEDYLGTVQHDGTPRDELGAAGEVKVGKKSLVRTAEGFALEVPRKLFGLFTVGTTVYDVNTEKSTIKISEWRKNEAVGGYILRTDGSGLENLNQLGSQQLAELGTDALLSRPESLKNSGKGMLFGTYLKEAEESGMGLYTHSSLSGATKEIDAQKAEKLMKKGQRVFWGENLKEGRRAVKHIHGSGAADGMRLRPNVFDESPRAMTSDDPAGIRIFHYEATGSKEALEPDVRGVASRLERMSEKGFKLDREARVKVLRAAGRDGEFINKTQQVTVSIKSDEGKTYRLHHLDDLGFFESEIMGLESSSPRNQRHEALKRLYNDGYKFEGCDNAFEANSRHGWRADNIDPDLPAIQDEHGNVALPEINCLGERLLKSVDKRGVAVVRNSWDTLKQSMSSKDYHQEGHFCPDLAFGALLKVSEELSFSASEFELATEASVRGLRRYVNTPSRQRYDSIAQVVSKQVTSAVAQARRS